MDNPNDLMTHYYPSSSYTSGAAVNKIGSNNGFNSGTIRSTSITVPMGGGIIHVDQVWISNRQDSGDSGGPVFTTVVRTNPLINFNSLIGIATIRNNTDASAYVSKVHNIMTEFTLTPDYGEV
jgi:hypothetical protein